MSYMHGSLAFELYRPTIARNAPIAGVLLLVAAFWLAALDGHQDSLGSHGPGAVESAPVSALKVKAGALEVPIYFFPDAATGTDTYATARDLNCGGASSATAP